jgi:hypothetical protein
VVRADDHHDDHDKGVHIDHGDDDLDSPIDHHHDHDAVDDKAVGESQVQLGHDRDVICIRRRNDHRSGTAVNPTRTIDAGHAAASH